MRELASELGATDDGSGLVLLDGRTEPAVWLVLEGRGRIEPGNGASNVSFARSDTLLIPARMTAVRLSPLSSTSTLLRSTVVVAAPYGKSSMALFSSAAPRDEKYLTAASELALQLLRYAAETAVVWFASGVGLAAMLLLGTRALPTAELALEGTVAWPLGAHGHGGIKDLVFGATIDAVRHDLDIPILIVRPPRT